MDACERRVLLVDHTKFRRRGLFQLAPVTDFDFVVVDIDIDIDIDVDVAERDLDALQTKGVEVLVAQPE